MWFRLDKMGRPEDHCQALFLRFYIAAYYEGPLNWIGVDSYTGTEDERWALIQKHLIHKPEHLERLQPRYRRTPDIVEDAYRNYTLYKVKTLADSEVKILAFEAHKFTWSELPDGFFLSSRHPDKL
jgi:hypothetical protein